MTANKNLKRRVRARAAKTGESYTTALRQIRPTPETRMRLAVAQTVLRGDPRDAAGLRESGREVRRLMREARAAGARLVHFPEGATCSPHKRVKSVDGPDVVGPADWERVAWDVLRKELAATAELAGKLRLWTVLGSVHRLSAPHRPHNSLYVISDRGRVATRYDERLLSYTKISFMYAPGAEPVTFVVDGVRFGCLLGMEVHYAELFHGYEKLDVDCVLFSTAGGAPEDAGRFALEAQGHAASNSYWVSYAGPTRDSADAPSGVIGPEGQWVGRCPRDGTAAVTVVELTEDPGHARDWRRTARGGLYEPHLVQDPRSADRAAF